MRPSYILQEALRSINRNRGSFILAATVQAICLVLLSVFIVLTFNLFRLSEAARRHVELYAFVSDQAEPTLLVERIGSLDGVAQARYVPKDEALTELRADLGPDSSLVDALDQNPLPASVRITVRPGFASLSELTALEQKIQLIPGITEVWSGKEMVERLERITRTVTYLDIGILVIVFLAVLFIAFQTVESSIASRQHEIQIMELVGATGAAVRLPFVIEGTAQGIIGGTAAFVLVVLFQRLTTVVIPAASMPTGLVVLADVGLGALSGVVGSLIALNRIHRIPQAVVMDDSEE
jgi:cell division transport system permease protein